jgi:hypothetical protein
LLRSLSSDAVGNIANFSIRDKARSMRPIAKFNRSSAMGYYPLLRSINRLYFECKCENGFITIDFTGKSTRLS